jgi:hypothetical protein
MSSRIGLPRRFKKRVSLGAFRLTSFPSSRRGQRIQGSGEGTITMLTSSSHYL